MNKSIISFNTRNNTYHLIKISKTTYEEEQERKERIRYMIFQKVLGILAFIVSLIMIAYGITPALLLTIVGTAVMLTNDRVIG